MFIKNVIRSIVLLVGVLVLAFSTPAGAKTTQNSLDVTAIDIAGLDIDHPRVTHINDVMAQAFAGEASLYS